MSKQDRQLARAKIKAAQEALGEAAHAAAHGDWEDVGAHLCDVRDRAIEAQDIAREATEELCEDCGRGLSYDVIANTIEIVHALDCPKRRKPEAIATIGNA